MNDVYWIHDITPQPWEVQAQSYKAGGRWCKARLISPDQLREYRDELSRTFVQQYPLTLPARGLLKVEFKFWRNTADGAELADATNLLKATEDALEGILYDNDRNNRLVSSEIIQQDDQAPNAIMVTVSEYEVSAIEIPPRIIMNKERRRVEADIDVDAFEL